MAGKTESRPSADHSVCGKTSDAMAARVEDLADSILRAAGSGLKHYTEYSRRRILMAAMDGYEAAYRAGADFAVSRFPQPPRSE